MGLSSIVNVIISASSQNPTTPGFGVPMIAAYHTHNTDLIRYYGSTAAMLTDNFTTTEPAYLAAQAIMSQNPAPTQFAVGRRSNQVTQIVDLTPTAKDSTAYNVTINGTKYTFTSGVGTTLTLIINGLVTAIGSPANVTPTNIGPNVSLRLTGVAGTFFTWSASDGSGAANGMGLWSAKNNTASSSVANDLAAIAAASSGWYAFVLADQNATDGAAAATWAEANGKLFAIDLADNDIKGSGTSDLASTVKTAAQQRTFVSYHQTMAEFMAAAWLGNVLPTLPGSETWAYKTLASVSADVLSDTEVTNISGKAGNWYQAISGINITQAGTVGKSTTTFIDFIRFQDWLKANIQSSVFGVLTNSQNPKVPYTDQGFAQIEAAIRGILQTGVKNGALVDGQNTVTMPVAGNESSANRQGRTIPDIFFGCKYASAVHTVTINGVITF